MLGSAGKTHFALFACITLLLYLDHSIALPVEKQLGWGQASCCSDSSLADQSVMLRSSCGLVRDYFEGRHRCTNASCLPEKRTYTERC